ncbi:MAG: conserved rane protein of unknown function [Nitrospira sp.]|nr:conserved rane protein of unknown function [Nitrospira sp.]
MRQRYGVGALWLLAMLLGLWLVVTKVVVHSELGDLLPDGTTAPQRLLLTQVRSGQAGRMLLLAIEGGNPDELADISKSLRERLQATGHFVFIANGNQTVERRDWDILFRWRYLLSPQVGPESFSSQSLRRTLEQRLDDLRSPLAPVIKPTLREDPTGEALAILAAVSPAETPASHRGVWMSRDRSRALLVAETRATGFDADAQAQVLQHVRALFASLVGALPFRLHMSGPGVFAVEIKRTIEMEAWWLSMAAATLVLVFLYASYRSVTLVLLSAIPLTSGILAGMLAVQGWFGFIHGITLGFGIALLGVVDDYPIHLFSHLTARGSAGEVIRAIWPTMRLGVLTTTIGFASLLLSGFPALAQLGVFAVVGLLTGAAVTRWILPLFVPDGFVPRHAWAGYESTLQRVSRMKPLVPVAVLLASSALLWSHTPIWQTDLAELSPVPERQKQLDHELRQELSAPDVRDLLMIEGPAEEAVLRAGETVMPEIEQLRRDGVIAGYDLISRYLPSHRLQQQRQQSLPESHVLERNVETAVKGLPFTAGLFTPFIDAVDGARSQSPAGRTLFEGTALGMKMASLLFEQQGQWIGVVPLRAVEDRQRLKQIVTGWNVPQVDYVDLKEESNRLMTDYRDRTFSVVLWGGLAIAVILAIALKSFKLVGPVFLPILSALIVMVALVNASGLGLDYALFFNRSEGTAEERARTLYGLFVCATTTILVFGVLATSTIPVLHAIGLTASVGSFGCLLFTGLMAKDKVHASG